LSFNCNNECSNIEVKVICFNKRSPNLKFFSDDEKYISIDLILQTLTTYLIDRNLNKESVNENFKEDFDKIFEFLPNLQKGMNVNIKFTKYLFLNLYIELQILWRL
jgi:hypothetical protein